MSAASPWLTDSYWLAANDRIHGRRCIDENALGLGLGAGMLAELILGGFLELRQGALFRVTVEMPDERMLRELLVTMAGEEVGWSSLPLSWTVPAPGAAAGYRGSQWSPAVGGRHQQPTAHHGSRYPHHDQYGRLLPLQRPDGDGPRWLPAHSEDRQVRRGHELGLWLRFLACDGWAEQRVAERLVPTGLVMRQQHPRWLRRPIVRIVPRDSVVAGMPANRISDGWRRGHDLSLEDLLLAGLFLATGLHRHALATLEPVEMARLDGSIQRDLGEQLLTLLAAVDTAVADAAMCRR